MSEKPCLTIGVYVRDDYHGAVATLSDLIHNHASYLDCEYQILVVDSTEKGSVDQLRLRDNVRAVPHARYIHVTGPHSSWLDRRLLVSQSSGDYVIACRSGVTLQPGSVVAVQQFFAKHPDSSDLIVGPRHSEPGMIVATNQMIRKSEPYVVPSSARVHRGIVWSNGHCGVDVIDDRWRVDDPFDVQQQSTDVIAIRKAAWPEVKQTFSGDGGTDTLLCELVRRRGDHVLCLPGMGWIASDTPEDRGSWYRNYVSGFRLLGDLDLYFSAVTHYTGHCLELVGPGSRLELRINQLGITLSGVCQCKQRVAEMDNRGAEWCRNNIETIVGWLQEGAAQWKAEQGGIKKTWLAIVPEFAERAVLRRLISDAVR